MLCKRGIAPWRTSLRPGVLVIGVALLGGSIPAVADPRDDFTKLESAMLDANMTYFAALEKLDEEQSEAVTARHKSGNPPVDGRKAVLKEMDALADASLGSPSATYINFETFSWSADIEPGNALPRFRRLAKHFRDDDALADLVSLLPDLLAESGPTVDWSDALGRLANLTKSQEVKLTAFLLQGRVLMALKKPDAAAKSFRQVLALKPDPDLTKTARGFLFEIEHLQIGMVAPDFTTRTLDGEKVSLSSFRGKAVLLKFWASW